MNLIEKKILTYFLKDMNFTNVQIGIIADQVIVIKREVDKVGFHTTLNFPNVNDIDNEIRWDKVSGETSGGILVGFAVYKYQNNLIIEGFTFDDDYPQDETDYEILLND